jgi:hypothetical protein
MKNQYIIIRLGEHVACRIILARAIGDGQGLCDVEHVGKALDISLSSSENTQKVGMNCLPFDYFKLPPENVSDKNF